MKTVFCIVFLLSSLALKAKADCYPEQWKLPNKGKSCEFVSSFGTPIAAQLWSCAKDGNSKSLVLMTGQTVKQPVEGDICFVVEQVLEQN
jgi:hypothetical protein